MCTDDRRRATIVWGSQLSMCNPNRYARAARARQRGGTRTPGRSCLRTSQAFGPTSTPRVSTPDWPPASIPTQRKWKVPCLTTAADPAFAKRLGNAKRLRVCASPRSELDAAHPASHPAGRRSPGHEKCWAARTASKICAGLSAGTISAGVRARKGPSASGRKVSSDTDRTGSSA